MNTKPKILLIDDEADILHILSFILRKEGFEIDTATTGKEGLEKIISGEYQGVVTDLSMPEMDGLTMLKQLRAKNSYVPIIFLSGHANMNNEHEMINYGAFELIVKPHVEKVPEALRKLIKAHKEISSLEAAGGTSVEFLELLHSTDRKIT